MLKLRILTTARITAGLTGLLVSMLCLVSLLGLFPDGRQELDRRRAAICETSAVGFSLLADKHDQEAMRRYIESIAGRHSDILSMGVRESNGDLLIDVCNHGARWDASRKNVSDEAQVSVQLFSQGQAWGTVEVCFAAPGLGILGQLMSPAVAHGGLMAALCALVFYFYLGAVLRQLDPSRAVPKRVREALDTLAEGLLVLDQNERIILANRAFGETTGIKLDVLTGMPISRLPFAQSADKSEAAPWAEAIRTGKPVLGQLFNMSPKGKEDLIFSVSASPVTDEKGHRRGALASFENVTLLEHKKRELAVMVEHLRVSSTLLKQQNGELERLAMHDSLTDLLSRRPFFERLDIEWTSTTRYGHALSAVMLDVDFFKSVNDNWGHAAGDEVLRRVARCLQTTARASDVVCRYGGEEFVVLMPHTDIAEAALAAERFRAAVEELDFGTFSITVSLGVSALSEQPRDPQELLVQADKCLYIAKRTGRNKVVRWDQIPSDITFDEEAGLAGNERGEEADPMSIPFPAVTALISALAYRDRATAEHSRRVADLSVAAAEGLLSFRNCYVLEIAALLHDIGKIGVPDKVLLKAGPLTPEEWKMMRRNDVIGAEITRVSFGSSELSKIVECYQAHYGDPCVRPDLPAGTQIPLGARILAIADAYDSMVSDRIYRKGCPTEEAFAELRKCAGSQFDPELVERFISVVRDRDLKTDKTVSGVSRETALAIGLQVERLLAALDAQDHEALEVICGRVQSTAEKHGAAAIAAKASEVCSILEVDSDTHGLVEAAYELLDLCRSTQAAFLNTVDPDLDDAPGEPESKGEFSSAEALVKSGG